MLHASSRHHSIMNNGRRMEQHLVTPINAVACSCAHDQYVATLPGDLGLYYASQSKQVMHGTGPKCNILYRHLLVGASGNGIALHRR